ncbi:MAG: hypothetical protein QXV69_02650 [Sulfolobaceae archaeon]
MSIAEIRDTVFKILSEKYPNIIKESLEIKFYQSFKDRVDTFGRFQDDKGLYEFILSYEKNGKIRRFHINLIMPSKVRKDLEKKIYDKS